MTVKWFLAAAIGALLAVPVAASAHPFDLRGGTAFMPELPDTSLQAQGKLGPSWFPGPPPAAFDKSRNMRFLGFSGRPANAFAEFNSDIAFQGSRAYQGTFEGFRILNIRNPVNPQEIVNYEDCKHPSGQGDVVIYGDVLTRSWDSAGQNGMPSPEGWTCGGTLVPAGTQGLHVFDLRDPAAPKVAAYIPLPCGSHTATGVPDPRNGRLVVYSTPSDGNCSGIDIISIPLKQPSAAAHVRFEPAGANIACHDTGVILGKVLRAACAGGQGFAVWSLDRRDGGSLTDPALLYVRNMKAELGLNINTGHSAAFSNDGDTLIFGHEPNGGTSARCQPTGTVLGNATYPVQTDDMKSFFFFATDTGELKGKWTLTRDQTEFENCTLHNYNVVPTRTRDILVHGSYQSGIGVLDFSDPANAKEIAYADPEPITPGVFSIGGDWSSHYYNGLIYQSDITRGLLTWTVLDHRVIPATLLPRLNPQTQEYTTKRGRGW